ncbi:hypothetical protein [Butyrivibrio sp. X503]|uniref:hypothetical protein n=1 Tax=Butyrivibrio sp. X503 TaxID=2364878 RepID=UPI0013145853|nr:hypothetical protein [Butyrivibrio sp. X503]
MISKKIQKYIDEHTFCSEYLFKDYINKEKEKGFRYGKEYISHELVPSFYLSE